MLLVLCFCADAISQTSFWTNAVQPSTPAVGDTSAVTLGLRFTSDVPGTVTGIKFYKGSGNTGTHVGSLWSANGNQLAQVTFVNETTTGWQQANFSSPVLIQANTTYVVSYIAPRGRYAMEKYFNWANSTNVPLRVAGSSPGVYSYGSSVQFPTNSWLSSNYWVDVVFVPQSGTTPIQVSVSPGSTTLKGGQSQQFNASVTGTSNTAVTWSQSPQVGTISTSGVFTAPASITTAQVITITARSVADTTKAAVATVNLDPPGILSISLNPTSVILEKSQSRTFTAQITGSTSSPLTWKLTPTVGTISPSGTSAVYTAPATINTQQTVALEVRSVDNPSAYATATISLSPTLQPPSPGLTSFWPNTATPTLAQVTSDSNPVTLGLRFRSDVTGSVMSIRFYKGTNNTGTHVGTLWSNAGAKLGEVVFSSESASGWQKADFPVPIRIAANTDYVISYLAPRGSYALDQFYNWAGLTASPLRVAGSAPGVYAYGSAVTFPSGAWKNSNYWIDVVFAPDSGTAPPPVTTFMISGNVSGSSAVLSLSGPSTGTATTDASGNYSFTGLPGGLYVVSPSRTGYAFTPSTRSVTISSMNVAGVNFSAAPIPPGPKTVMLSWGSSQSANVVGYNVYRSITPGGPYVKINGSVVGSTSYVDSNVSSQQTYHYVATSVDSSGLESTYSNQASVLVN